MSTILEFYIEKEKRELINTINSAKYMNEEQKEAMIGILSDDWASDRRDAANKTQDPHRLQAKKGERKRKQDAEHRDEMRKKREKMSQSVRDWAADRSAAAQAAG
jgi:hypothetical protein